MDIEIIAEIATVIVFGGLGVWFAARRSKPFGKIGIVLLAVGAAWGGVFGKDARLVQIFDFQMPLNVAIISFCSGAIVGSLVRSGRRRLPEEA